MVSTSRPRSFASHKAALRVVIIYAIFSLLWIGFSDLQLFSFVKNPELLTKLQTLKGLFFVFVTSFMIYILLFREISKVRRIETSFRDSEEKYRLMAERTGQLIYDYDVHTGNINWSGAIMQLTGFTSEDFQNVTFDSWMKIIHEDDRDLTLTFLQDAIDKKSLYTTEYRFKHKNDSFVIVEDRGSCLRDETGKVCRILGNIKDISERKQMDEHLRHSQKMEAIGTLAGGIAHDFNNILGAILGYTEMAKFATEPESRIVRDLDQVLKACDRAKGLVKQILAFSRQESAECIPLQPANTIAEVVKMLRPSLPTTIQIVQTIDTEAGIIFADPTEIHQILMNLCTNAFHAMEETGGKLSISLKETDLNNDDLIREPHIKAGKFVKIKVCDTGNGIAQDIKDQIFNPYFTTKKISKGTGMGLSIVHSIVKNYGGFISFLSEPGKGTAFSIFLPALAKELLPENKDTKHIPLGRERLLFIDDEEVIADMGKALLESLGYHVTISNDSLVALKTFQNNPDAFDLVITDQTMPNLAGAELAKRMMQIRPDIPIILCTGYSTIISQEKAKAMGIKEFALKPLSKMDIAMLIRKALDSK